MLDLLVLEDDVFQRCLPAQLDPIGASEVPQVQSALSSCVISTPRLTCRSTARFSLCSCWTSPTGVGLSPRAPALRRGMSSPLRQRKLHSARYPDPAPFLRPDPQQPWQPTRPLTDLLTALAATLGRRQLHNVPPLHTAQVVHEVVSEEYCILDTLNYEMTVLTPADRVRLFETRFSLNVEWLMALFARARPFRGTRKHGPASGKRLCA